MFWLLRRRRQISKKKKNEKKRKIKLIKMVLSKESVINFTPGY